MQIQTGITGWQQHIEEGRRYLQTAGNGSSRADVFNNELVFQLTAMAIEKLIAGMVQFHRRMPIDHTLSGLVADLSQVCPLEPDLIDRICEIETIDDMCTLSPARRRPPGDRDVQKALTAGRRIAEIAGRYLPESREEPS